MGRQAVFTMVLIMAMMGNKTLAGVNVVFNGSFENDGDISPITIVDTPDYWWDVNFPPQFSGNVFDAWSTNSSYCLTIFSKATTTFLEDDMATISQELYMGDANEIVFDLRLETFPSSQVWDPAKRSAVVLIDDVVVWESNSVGGDVRGNYFDQTIDISGINDSLLHKLSLGIIVNEADSPAFQYLVRWDYMRFDLYCQGHGYLPPDLDADCDVDWDDLEILASHWLPEIWSQQTVKCNLFTDGEIDSSDFAVFADYWLTDSFSYDDEHPDSLLSMDLNSDGTVDFIDFAILTVDVDSPDYGDVSEMASQWLLTSWLYGL